MYLITKKFTNMVVQSGRSISQSSPITNDRASTRQGGMAIRAGSVEILR